jgi:hypothetical protein
MGHLDRIGNTFVLRCHAYFLFVSSSERVGWVPRTIPFCFWLSCCFGYVSLLILICSMVYLYDSHLLGYLGYDKGTGKKGKETDGA